MRALNLCEKMPLQMTGDLEKIDGEELVALSL